MMKANQQDYDVVGLKEHCEFLEKKLSNKTVPVQLGKKQGRVPVVSLFAAQVVQFRLR